jgi:plastocyanin
MMRAQRRESLVVLRVAGAGLLVATAAIHLDLYLTGYRQIPVIGWLFLLQCIAAFLLALAVLISRSRLAAAAGAGFALATLGGYLLSLWFGLFGFTEHRTTAGIVAGVIEVAAFAALAVVALLPAPGEPAAAAVPWAAALSGPRTWWLVTGLSVVALAVLAGSVAQAGAPAATGGQQGQHAALIIVIKNFRFMPAQAHVKPGARVEVKNEDSLAHTLSAGPSAAISGLFNTGTIGAGQAGFFTAPAKAGTYPFFCKFHHFMTGTLVVGNASAAAAPARASLTAGIFPPGSRYAAAMCGRLPRRHSAVPARLTTAAWRHP